MTTLRRSLLDGVLAVVQDLGGSTGLQAALDVIAGAVVDVLGFGAAAINVTTADGDLRVDAVVGPPGVQQLLGTRRPMSFWLDVLDAAEPWGELRFFSHERDQALVDQFVSWRPSTTRTLDPDAWHPDDSLLAPMWDAEHNLVGVLSVDEPRTGRRPGLEQRTVLEVLATQAARAIHDAQVKEAAEAERRAAQSRWQLVFEHSPSGAALVAPDGTMLTVNEAMAAMLGFSRERLQGMKFADISHPDDVGTDLTLFGDVLAGRRVSYRMEKRYLHGDGHVVNALLHVGAVHDDNGNVQMIVGQISDITERKLAEHRLAHQMTHDAVTDLPNRMELGERMAEYLADDRPAALFMCDIDRFKTINDALGRVAGDEVLREVARRLGGALPRGGVLGSGAADEFLVLAPGEWTPDILTDAGERLIASLRRPVVVGGLRHTVSLSVGAVATEHRHDHADELLREAQHALYRAKQRGGCRVEVYDPRHDHPGTRHDIQLEQDLREAIDDGNGLQAFIQPIVSIDDRAVVGAESLVRWNHPRLGLLQPADFLPLAQASGLIVGLGWRMIDLAASAAAEGRGGWISVNVSGSQLGLRRLPMMVQRALTSRDLMPGCLRLEITETALVDASPEAVAEIGELAEMGVGIALDDFGTGYSSLSLLLDLPVDVVKIDRSFIRDIAHDRRAAALVRSVVTMCKALGIDTIAEGVETSAQLALVSALGCDFAQGFLFGRPGPVGAGSPGSGAG